MIDNKPQLNARNLPSQASSASFYLSEGESIEGIPYFYLPRSIMGNQINSYGGYISYTLSFSGPLEIDAPDFIITVCFVLMGDGAARHATTLRVTEPCRVMTHHNKRLKNCTLEGKNQKFFYFSVKDTFCITRLEIV